jgi:non-ribosomal peptide synthetase component F
VAAARWRWRIDSPGLVNMYGITETTVHVTWRPLGAAEILGGGGSVIGVPLDDLRDAGARPLGRAGAGGRRRRDARRRRGGVARATSAGRS